MDQQQQKTVIVFTALICLTALQISAWALGYDGFVFTFTSSVFSAIIGLYLGIKITLPKQ